MPASSAKQRRFIYARAAAGEVWAKRYVAESGGRIRLGRRKKSKSRRRT